MRVKTNVTSLMRIVIKKIILKVHQNLRGWATNKLIIVWFDME